LRGTSVYEVKAGSKDKFARSAALSHKLAVRTA